MSKEIRTLELARLYEHQGYYKEALEMYSHLDGRESEIQAGINRMNKKMEDAGYYSYSEKKISLLFEKWLMLMVLGHRLNNFIRIKKRLS